MRIMRLILSLLLVAAHCQIAAGKDYPNRPLRFLVPHAAGGPTDIMARVVGQRLAENLGETIVIDNRPGAGGNVGTALVARANPDGYTILINSSAFAVNPSLYRNPGYDALKSFAPIIVAGLSPNIVFVHPSFAAHTLQELVASARGKQLSYASPGTGTTPHLTAEFLLKTLNKLDLTHIPYNGAGLAVNSVVGGQLPIGCTAMPPVVPMVKAGRLRGIVVTSPKRAAALPEVPTVAESGFPGYEDYTWIAFFAPAGTSRTIVDKLNAEIAKILQSPAVKERLATLAFEFTPNAPQQFAEYLKVEVVKWAKVVKDSGARAD